LAYVDGDGADALTNTSCANRRHVLYSGKKRQKKEKKRKGKTGEKNPPIKKRRKEGRIGGWRRK